MRGGASSSCPGCELSVLFAQAPALPWGGQGAQGKEPREVVLGTESRSLLLLPAESLIRSCSIYSPLGRLVFSSPPAGPSFPFERERLF